MFENKSPYRDGPRLKHLGGVQEDIGGDAREEDTQQQDKAVGLGPFFKE
jgi:hypothetical protein